MSNAEIGARLRMLRGDTPRKTVADAIGVSVSALQMYENGQRIPRDQTKMAFAVFYNTTVEAIFFNP
jgi:transcriptional regulator with XRE-family HTH domain